MKRVNNIKNARMADATWPKDKIVKFSYGMDEAEIFARARGLAVKQNRNVFIAMGNFSYMVTPIASDADFENFKQSLHSSLVYQKCQRQYLLEVKRGQLYLEEHFSDMKDALDGSDADLLQWLLNLETLYKSYGHEFVIDADYIARQLKASGYTQSTLTLKDIQRMPQNQKIRHLVEYTMKSLYGDYHGLPQALATEMKQVLELNLANEKMTVMLSLLPSSSVKSSVQKGAVPTPKTLSAG